MTDNKSDLARAQLKAELIEEIKRELEPKPEKTWAEIERENAEHFDRVHAMRERQANAWSHPSAVQEMAQHPCNQVMRGVIQDRHAPTSPSMAGTSGQATHVHLGGGASSTPGWSDPTPLRPPEGIQWVDAQMIADEVRQRAELKRKLGE
jgi:hypothetical protein